MGEVKDADRYAVIAHWGLEAGADGTDAPREQGVTKVTAGPATPAEPWAWWSTTRGGRA